MMQNLIIAILIISTTPAFGLDRIALSPDRASFIHATTQKPFHPWGLNYDRDFRMRLLEDYWQTEWPTVVEHFAEMKRLGANVVRIHLQLPRFMDAPDKPNAASLAQLQKLLALAEKNGLYLDLTGLACYRRADVPNWYTNLDEPARWQAQERFWSAIAQTCSNSPAVFCYDLVNEPSVPSNPRKPNDWLAGDLAGFTYCQVITLDPKGRDRTRLATDWIDKMTAAIRQHDRQTLITVGLLPFPTGTGFDAQALANHLDFLSVHYYPKKEKLDDQAQFLKKFKTTKPLIVEEIFPLNCSTADLNQFMSKSPFVAGWVGFYWGHRQQDLQKSTTPADRMVAAWLGFFQTHNPHPTSN
jgi:hypothetical protein